VESIVGAAIERLHEARIPLGPGLASTGLANVEQPFGFRFGPEHAALLSAIMPMALNGLTGLGS
jgi:hypothetical protein